MSNIEKMCRPLNKHEDDFIIMISKFSGIGYGRMKQIITGLWANFLMEGTDVNEKGALLGALDLTTWVDQEKGELQRKLEIQTKRVENLKKSNEFYATGDAHDYNDSWIAHYKNGHTRFATGKLARECQAIDQELEKQLEELK